MPLLTMERATNRSVSCMASGRKYMVTPSHEKNAGSSAQKPVGNEPVGQLLTLEIDRHIDQ